MLQNAHANVPVVQTVETRAAEAQASTRQGGHPLPASPAYTHYVVAGEVVSIPRNTVHVGNDGTLTLPVQPNWF